MVNTNVAQYGYFVFKNIKLLCNMDVPFSQRAGYPLIRLQAFRSWPVSATIPNPRKSEVRCPKVRKI